MDNLPAIALDRIADLKAFAAGPRSRQAAMKVLLAHLVWREKLDASEVERKATLVEQQLQPAERVQFRSIIEKIIRLGAVREYP